MAQCQNAIQNVFLKHKTKYFEATDFNKTQKDIIFQ